MNRDGIDMSVILGLIKLPLIANIISFKFAM